MVQAQKIRTIILPCLRRIVQLGHHLCLTFLRADNLLRSHRCEWKNGPDDSVYIITLFLCRLISDDCYEDRMFLNSICILLWWMCSTV
jgi:hypothetical protein